jgi:hypothetical protein
LVSLMATIEIDGGETEALMQRPRIDADIPQYRFSAAEATPSTFPPQGGAISTLLDAAAQGRAQLLPSLVPGLVILRRTVDASGAR